MTVFADQLRSRTCGKHRRRIARRITKDYAGGSTNDEDFYFNENYQVVEVRKNSDTDAAQRFLWDVIYIDAPAMVEIDTNTDGTRDFRLWPTFDGNFNVTSLVTDQGKVVERYACTPYLLSCTHPIWHAIYMYFSKCDFNIWKDIFLN